MWRLLAAVMVMLLASLPVAAENAMRSPDFAATKIQLLPAPDRQPISFDVRLATTPAEQAYGLMSVSYTHLRAPRDVEESRMPSSA